MIEDGNGAVGDSRRRPSFDVAGEVPFDLSLQIKIEGRPNGAALQQGELPVEVIDQVGGSKGQILGRADRQGHLEEDPVLGIAGMLFDPALKELVPGAFELRKAAGGGRVALHGVLGDDAQAERLGQGQVGCGFVKVDQAGGFHPLDVAPVGGEIEIGLEDLGLAVMAGQLNGPKNLDDLSRDGPGLQVPAQASHLHGNGRSADRPLSDHVAAPESPAQGQGIDAGMMVEIAVLVQEGGLFQFRGNPIKGNVDAVALIRGQGEAQQPVVAIVEGARITVKTGQVRPGEKEVDCRKR